MDNIAGVHGGGRQIWSWLWYGPLYKTEVIHLENYNQY